MEITSSGIDAAGKILPRYTVDGDNINPPLTFSQIPDQAASLVLVMEDPDASGGIFTHWVIYDMSPATMQILDGHMPLTGKLGVNSFGNVKYDGPAPPSGTHRYYFRLYALGRPLDLPEGVSREEILGAMDGDVIASAELMGTYTKK